MNNLLKQRWSRWLLVLALCLLIYLATNSAAYTADSTRALFGPLNVVIRKATHLTVFGLLAGLARWALIGWRWEWIGAWSFATLWGAVDEWHQLYVPNRGASISDVVLNSVGAFFALLILYVWVHRKDFVKKN